MRLSLTPNVHSNRKQTPLAVVASSSIPDMKSQIRDHYCSTKCSTPTTSPTFLLYTHSHCHQKPMCLTTLALYAKKKYVRPSEQCDSTLL